MTGLGASLSVTTEPGSKSGEAIVRVTGEVDVATAPRLGAMLVKVIDDGATTVVVDLSETDYLDSAGLGVLVAACKRLRTNGADLAVRSPRPGVRTVLEIAGLTGFLNVGHG